VTAGGFLRYWLPPLLYLVLIFLLSGMSSPPLPVGWDGNLLHYPEYAVLGLLLARALEGGRRAAPLLPFLVGAFLLAVVLGALDELHQSFVPGRMPDPVDWFHDAVGAAAGAAAWGIWRWIRSF